ncbi:hypothetical protein D9M70_568310 [compost metagenome]
MEHRPIDQLDADVTTSWLSQAKAAIAHIGDVQGDGHPGDGGHQLQVVGMGRQPDRHLTPAQGVQQ